MSVGCFRCNILRVRLLRCPFLLHRALPEPQIAEQATSTALTHFLSLDAKKECLAAERQNDGEYLFQTMDWQGLWKWWPFWKENSDCWRISLLWRMQGLWKHGQEAKTLWVYHPSAGYSWDWWHKIIKIGL